MLFLLVHMCSSDGVMIYIYHICLNGHCRYNYFQVQRDVASIQVSPLNGVYLCKYSISLLCGACFDPFCIFPCTMLLYQLCFPTNVSFTVTLCACIRAYCVILFVLHKFIPVSLTVYELSVLFLL